MGPMVLTVIVEGWDTSDQGTQLKVHAIKRFMVKLLKDYNWVGAIEIVRVNNAKPPAGDGKRVCVHAHLIVWSGDNRHIRKGIKARCKGVNGGGFGAKPVDFKPIPGFDHLEFRLAYLLKLPVHGKRVVTSDVADRYGELHRRQVTKGDNQVVYRATAKLYLLLDRYTMRDLLCCGGVGRKIINDVERQVIKYRLRLG